MSYHMPVFEVVFLMCAALFWYMVLMAVVRTIQQIRKRRH